MIQQFFIFLMCTAAVVAAVRILLISGVEELCAAYHLSEKARGQILGYATSFPEFLVVVVSALMGIFEAGFWNIASSNIINWVLFLLAAGFYRQHRELSVRLFWDEILFGLASVLVPLTMFWLGFGPSPTLSAVLLAFFIFYRVLDHRLNRKSAHQPPPRGKAPSRPIAGLVKIAAGLFVLTAASHYLGISARTLILEVKVPALLVGWISGFITSIPEMASFFEIYRREKHHGRHHLLDDTQVALDTLVSSNMSNLGIILPIGIMVSVFV